MEEVTLDMSSFDYIFQYGVGGMCLVSLDGRCLRANKSVCYMLGYTEEEILKTTFWDITHPDDIELTIKKYKHTLEKNTLSYQYEKRYLHKDGSIIWALVISTLVKNKSNKQSYYFTQIQDITEYKRIENELKKSQERYIAAVKGSKIGIWDWPDIKQDEQYWSPQYKKLLGYKDSEIESSASAFFKMQHPNDSVSNKKAFEQHLRNTGSFDIEYRLRNKAGKYQWFQVKGTVSTNKTTKSKRVTGSISLIQKRKESEQKIEEYTQALEESKERYELVLRATRDGIWDNPDLSQDDEYWSPQWKKLLGYKEDEIESKSSIFFSMIHPDDAPAVKKAFDAHINSPSKPYNPEARIKTKSGEYRWFQGKGIVTEDKKTGIKRITGSITDIHAKKTAEDALERSKQQILEYTSELERINQELDMFAYIISHDLQEPLRGICNNAYFLLDTLGSTSSKPAAKHIDRIFYLCEHMEKLINDLLYFAKLKNQEMIIRKVDLNPIIDDLKIIFEEANLTQNIEIFLPKPLPKVICDEVSIKEVFRNLITNALKYNNSDKKVVEIGCEQVSDDEGIPKYVFYVKDNGIGIDQKSQSEIFHIFKRLNNVNNAIRGTGMGLTFAKKIIERHEGKIWIESAAGEGSTFYFTLH